MRHKSDKQNENPNYHNRNYIDHSEEKKSSKMKDSIVQSRFQFSICSYARELVS